MSLDPFLLGIVIIVAVVVLIQAITKEHRRRLELNSRGFLNCFMRDLKDGRYERK